MPSPGTPRVPADDSPELRHSLMERAPVPMAELEGMGHILRYVNPAFCRLVGKERAALMGRPFAETVPEGDHCLFVLDRVYRTAEPEIHTELEAAGFHSAYWSYAVWPVVGADQGSVGVMIQITETTRFHQQTGAMNQELLLSSVRQHELTEVTEKRNEELEQRVFERTQELEQSQHRLRALATELNLAEQRERKQLAMELHDHLQQMLVLGKLKLGQGKRLAEIAPAVVTLMRETDEVLSDALKYTRTLVTELSPTVLRDHGLSAGLIWLGQYMQKHGVTVTVTVPDEELKLPEDQVVLLFQSVRELLINSSKHAHSHEASVLLEEKDGALRIEVQDHGVGFDLAAAAAAAAAAGTPGGGISSKFGLFSIRERMRALGGSFELASTPGQGTTATLGLPLPSHGEDKVLSTELSGTARKVRSKHSALKKNAPIRILLVDDHLMMRQGLRSIVTAYDHLEIVGEAGDGAEAVELAKRLEPDVVVMDINMPKMDGIEATRQIKAKQPATVVIGLSVNQSADTEKKTKAAGASAYLTKESAVDALCHAIEEAVSYKQHSAARPVC